MSRPRVNGDKSAKNAGEPADPVEEVNAKPDDLFIKEYLPSLPCEWTHPVSKTRYAISLLQAARLTEAQVNRCFGIVDQTSGRDYRLSRQGWHPSAKKEEMRSPDLRYILVRRGEEICGFTSLMPTWENGEAVVYCYEIHLTDEVKGTGLGSQLMGYLTEVAERAEGIDKVMLTCFVSNKRARRFYERLGFGVDENSPRERRLRGKLIAADYVIMSRRVRRRTRKPVAGGDGMR
ncbi:N alpha-acetyl-transferase [Metarhizium acridum]|uniref:N-alpha-acetyltransferase 40 n=1 Tax=Metarhizium acridum (strain CQMa 102) TaxID=655827 RepID=E9E8P3_METAQ|nr:GNAT family acetyltransferase Nat4 [Metarhizium acridum CQMa 102]EFY87715.1 GNAT family acetyltransferase Nat4 [Metarhizium acridum CQMa 102]KAG8408901.1 N alpha-acetyl-transferase [Metarhizium acridum]KAG8422006.1 N alpha-acetyl-transferase [Metarhizium acridum]